MHASHQGAQPPEVLTGRAAAAGGGGWRRGARLLRSCLAGLGRAAARWSISIKWLWHEGFSGDCFLRCIGMRGCMVLYVQVGPYNVCRRCLPTKRIDQAGH